MSPEIWTIGHSSRSLDEFLALLAGSSIGLVADVRKLPGSKRYPHFDREALEASLPAVGIAYRHYPEFGGRRDRRAAGSPNAAWRIEAFNAFADHMESPEFRGALDDLTARARDVHAVVMCSEAVPWKCHRRLISDALVVRGWTVLDIMSPTKVDPHKLTDFARVDGLRITYPAEPLFPGE